VETKPLFIIFAKQNKINKNLSGFAKFCFAKICAIAKVVAKNLVLARNVWSRDVFAYGFEFAKLFDKVNAPAVSLTPLVPPQQIHLCKLGLKSHRTSGVNDSWSRLSGFSYVNLVQNHIAPAVSMTPLVPPQRCH
jgi:hypothetical protein